MKKEKHSIKIATDGRSLLGADHLKVLACILIFNLLTHFIQLSRPDAVVFDEVHFGSFATAYCCSHETFFDIHPPHGKLLIAAGSYVLGYRGEQDFSSINVPYEEGNAFAFRALPALIGSTIPLLVFLLLVQMGGTLAGATFAAALVSIDSAILVQTRIVGLDGILIASILCTILLFLKGIGAQTPRKKMIVFFMAGMVGGVAVGTKLTGLVALGVPFVIFLVDLIKAPKQFQAWLRDGSLFVAGALVAYLGGWTAHFLLLDQPWPDIWGPISGNFILDFFDLHFKAFNANVTLTAGHPDAAAPWLWPFSHTPVYYWAGDGDRIYLIGNLLVWWGAVAMFSITLVYVFLTKLMSFLALKIKPFASMIWLPIVAYVISYAPLILTSRALFIYHYMTALLFSIMAVVLWLEHVGWIREGSVRSQRASYFVVLVFAVLLFAMFLPFVYGYSVGLQPLEALFVLFPSWV